MATIAESKQIAGCISEKKTRPSKKHNINHVNVKKRRTIMSCDNLFCSADPLNFGGEIELVFTLHRFFSPVSLEPSLPFDFFLVIAEEF